jgi:hypothetical protein
MATVLAIDLGKYKSTACEYHTEERTHTFEQLPTHPEAVQELIERCSPQRVVIEIGNQAGWVRDLYRRLGEAQNGTGTFLLAIGRRIQGGFKADSRRIQFRSATSPRS